MATLEEVIARLERIEAMLLASAGGGAPRDSYSPEEFATLVGRTAYTVREWCRTGRVAAVKSGRAHGVHQTWRIPASELDRYRNEGTVEPRQ